MERSAASPIGLNAFEQARGSRPGPKIDKSIEDNEIDSSRRIHSGAEISRPPVHQDLCDG